MTGRVLLCLIEAVEAQVDVLVFFVGIFVDGREV